VVHQRSRTFYFLSTQYAYNMADVVDALVAHDAALAGA
jgi:hypothetical protein